MNVVCNLTVIITCLCCNNSYVRDIASSSCKWRCISLLLMFHYPKGIVSNYCYNNMFMLIVHCSVMKNLAKRQARLACDAGTRGRVHSIYFDLQQYYCYNNMFTGVRIDRSWPASTTVDAVAPVAKAMWLYPISLKLFANTVIITCLLGLE